LVPDEAALEDGGGVARKAQPQQQVIDEIIPTEAFAPEKHRIHGAGGVEQDGNQEKLAISWHFQARRVRGQGSEASDIWEASVLQQPPTNLEKAF